MSKSNDRPQLNVFIKRKVCDKFRHPVLPQYAPSYNRLTRQTLSTGSTTDYGFDAQGRQTSIIHKKASGSVISQETYQFDPVGNMIAKTVDGVATIYGYDNADQLTSESRPGYTALYQYDGNGNRLAKTLNGVVEAYTYDDGDKMLTAGTKSYTYDLAGRTKTVTAPAGLTTLNYDDEDRLTQVTGVAGNQSYTYNGLDARRTKTSGGTTNTYKRNGVSPTAPVINDGQATYTPGISERRGGVSKWAHQDYLGSTKQLTDSAQTVTDTRQYDAFGMQTGTTGGTPTPFGFAGGWGYQSDETGLQLLGHRYYDPSTGRFLTRDPVGDGDNWYIYCANNPINGADPEGLWVPLVAIAVVFLLSSDLAIAPTGTSKDDEQIAAARESLYQMKAAAAEQLLFRSKSRGLNNPARKAAPNPYGRRGDPGTQKRIDEIEKAIKKKHPDWKHESGGTRPESNVRTDGGNKNSRGPDLIFRKPNGRKRYYQVGRTTKKGKPVSREKKALDDLKRNKEGNTRFFPREKP